MASIPIASEAQETSQANIIKQQEESEKETLEYCYNKINYAIRIGQFEARCSGLTTQQDQLLFVKGYDIILNKDRRHTIVTWKNPKSLGSYIEAYQCTDQRGAAGG